MKVANLITEQQEYIPREQKGRRSGDIGRQIYQRAQQEAYKHGRPNDKRMIKQIAEKMVNNLSANILAAVDEELQQSNMKQVNARKV